MQNWKISLPVCVHITSQEELIAKVAQTLMAQSPSLILSRLHTLPTQVWKLNIYQRLLAQREQFIGELTETGPTSQYFSAT